MVDPEGSAWLWYAAIFAIGALLTILVVGIVYELFYIPPIYRGFVYGLFGIVIWIVGLATLHLVYRIYIADGS